MFPIIRQCVATSKKIARGVTPINYISNTSPEELMMMTVLLKQAMGYVGQVEMEMLLEEDDFEPMEEDQQWSGLRDEK
ncbi:hypothetical protein DPMN_161681 [Dreissena polymorpha]|uniref:Uncharacterized protein n=1 Tax=Dreissena polymorpha TaxID=45954 RepID=A0A9D4ETL3_DREPO|nr:hypothetical protein DPMN_161681 [Dreissena polymorpha]